MSVASWTLTGSKCECCFLAVVEGEGDQTLSLYEIYTMPVLINTRLINSTLMYRLGGGRSVTS